MQGCHEPGAGPGAWHAPAIPRGDLQATFLFKGYDEVRRLGLSRGAEAAVRAAASAQAGGAGGGHPHLHGHYQTMVLSM